MGRKKKVIEEILEDDIEVKKLHSISGIIELMHLLQTGAKVYQSSNFIERVEISEETLLKLEFGAIIKMLKQNKLYRY